MRRKEITMSMTGNRCWTVILAFSCAAFAPHAFAQFVPPGYAMPIAYSQQDLDRMLAPIALYPDPLLSRILVAATRPREVVEASRWLRANPGLEGERAVQAASQAPWHPGVQSLAAFPQVLAMMEENPEWTRSVGAAFVAQELSVMDTVQALRRRAWAEGTLRTTPYATVASHGPMIVIQPARPEVVYVPYYDPLVVYGRWWHAAAPVRWQPWAGHARAGSFHWGPGTGRPAARERVEPRHVEPRHVEARPAPRRIEERRERVEERREHRSDRVERRPNASAGAGRDEARREERGRDRGNGRGHRGDRD
jgi:hypothetical protein